MIIVFQGSIDLVGFVQRARLHWKYFANLSPSHFPAAGSSSSGTSVTMAEFISFPSNLQEILLFYFFYSLRDERQNNERTAVSSQSRRKVMMTQGGHRDNC